MEVKRRTARSLVAKLSSVSEQIRSEALAELRLITKHDADSRPIVTEAGAIPYLAEILYSSSSTSQENAAATLLNLSISSRATLMSTRGLLDAISHALSHSSSDAAVQSCAATIHSLLIADESYRPIIGSKRDIIYSLVRIVTDSNSPARSIKDALKAMFGVALYPLNRATLIDLGAIPALVSIIVRDARTGIMEDASAVLAQIAGCEESEEGLRKAGGVRVLADLLDEGTGASRRIKENAVAALLNLARCGGEKGREEVREVAMKVLEGIADVAENGSSKGKAKAFDLLKIVLEGFEMGDSRFDDLLNHHSK
ncbi:hypothetical protein SLEP1_g47381 [Rubroshorea leprosula]|uniref:U-box domain-containing protein n=1 Tax=Rubroshorea leprosula TaxID=152421 RepID=A0AAV5LQA7_9ROSI|nr:hypothetical protein SLEP1_g47381 [Rubroshorea leprosula]